MSLRFPDKVPDGLDAPVWTQQMGSALKKFLQSLVEGVGGLQMTPGDPTQVQAGEAADPGTSQAAASANHAHDVNTAAPSVPVALGGSADEGTGAALMRADARLVLSGAGASVGDVPEWDGSAWVPTPGTAGGNISMSTLAPASDETITAGYGAYVPEYYEIASTKYLEIGDGAVFEIG